jgi:hypothetical protein
MESSSTRRLTGTVTFLFSDIEGSKFRWDAHRAEMQLRVRMAIHVGTADERDADYFGPTVNRVARLLAIGHGGQVLLSGAAVRAIDALPTEATLLDLGRHRLKDLAARAVEILSKQTLAPYVSYAHLKGIARCARSPSPLLRGHVRSKNSTSSIVPSATSTLASVRRGRPSEAASAEAMAIVQPGAHV